MPSVSGLNSSDTTTLPAAATVPISIGITKPVPKSTYAEHVRSPDGDIYIVGSGGYEIKQK